MGGGPVGPMFAQLSRLALIALGAFLLQATVRDALDRETSWLVIVIGGLAGAALAAAAVRRPGGARIGRRAAAGSGSTSGEVDPQDGLALMLALVALFVVVVQLQRYGAAVGAFCLVSGAVALDRAARRTRTTRDAVSRRRDPPDG